MRKIELLGWEELPRRIQNVKGSLEVIYDADLSVQFEDVTLDRLFPTEGFLEKDKLALVFMKVMSEGYDVPIIAVEHNRDHFILDGHHRSFISKKLGKNTIKACVLKFPPDRSYGAKPKQPLEGLPIRDVAAIDDPVVMTWGQILTLLKYYEAVHGVYFGMRKKSVALRSLVPTQPQVSRSRIATLKELLVPITCIRREAKYYILDGHARSLRARQLGLEEISAICLVPDTEVDFGIVRTANGMGLRSLEDIKIVE